MLDFIEVFKLIVALYPKEKELNYDKLVKITYLIDWRSAIVQKKQITNTKWYINNYGPYIDNMYETLTAQHIDIKNLLQHRDVKLIEFDKNTLNIVNFILNKTINLEYDKFVTMVFSTFPIATSTKYSYVNLVKMAEEYKKE